MTVNLLVLILLLLGGVFTAGAAHGRHDERSRPLARTRSLRGVLSAARSLAAAD